MFINFWYPAVESAKLTKDKPLQVEMLGQKFALFRDGEGKAHCVSNTCTHRGGSLGHGKMRNGNLECPYHGWQFDGTGACKMIPSLGKDGKIPARAKVDAYPVEEKYGIVFAFLGDAPEEERCPIMECPEYGTEGWRANLIVFDVKCNYERSIENGLDPAHNEFVHPSHGHDGERDDYVVPDYDIEDTAWGSGFMTEFEVKTREENRTHQELKAEKKEESIKSQAGTWHHGPAQMITKIHITETMWMHQYIYECPLDEGRIRVYLVNMRNCMMDPEMDAPVEERCLVIAGQDIVILEEMGPLKTPRTAVKEIIVPADAAIIRYRDWLKKWEDKGWRIDVSRTHAEEQENDIAFAIPSPSRRGEKNWVLDPIPLVQPSSAQKAAAE